MNDTDFAKLRDEMVKVRHELEQRRKRARAKAARDVLDNLIAHCDDEIEYFNDNAGDERVDPEDIP